MNEAYRKWLCVNRQTFDEHLDELIEYLGCPRNVAKPGTRDVLQKVFGTSATRVTDESLRALFEYPLAFDALYRACLQPPSPADPTWKASSEKRVTRSRQAVPVQEANQFPAVKGMRNRGFRTSFALLVAPYALDPFGNGDINLHALAKETFSFLLATCKVQLFKEVDPMCCALALKAGYGRSHLIASNADLARSNAGLKYDDPAHPNTYFVQIFGCYPAFLVMAGDTVRFYLPPEAVVRELRDSRGRVNVDKADFNAGSFDGYEEWSCRQGVGLAGLKELISDVAACVALAVLKSEGTLLRLDSPPTTPGGPGIKKFWFMAFLSTFQKGFRLLYEEVQMFPKEAFQVTAAFLTLPGAVSFSPEMFKEATLNNLQALSAPQPIVDTPQPITATPQPWLIEVHNEHIEWSDEEIMPAYEEV